MRKEKKDFSTKITSWVGSASSLVVHTIFFMVMFSLSFFGVESSDILLILTTIVSLEAIYLAIFIQITINQHSQDLEDVSEDIEEIQKDVEEISEDVEEIQKDVDEISEDVDEIQKDVEEISEDVDEISEDVGEIQKDVEEINEEEEDTAEDDQEEEIEKKKFEKIERTLEVLLDEINKLKKEKK